MSELERNKALVVEFWNAPFDEREPFFTDDIVWHLPPSVRVQGIEADVRSDGIVELFEMGFATYEPGMTWDVQHVLAEGDLVAKSPAGGGLPPYVLDDLLGRPLVRALERDEAILAADVARAVSPTAAR